MHEFDLIKKKLNLWEIERRYGALNKVNSNPVTR